MSAVTICHLDDLAGVDLAEFDLAVVIDVVRAFTVAPLVLRQGARSLLLAPDVEAAVRARDAEFPGALLLKDGAPDPRFDLPNSPGVVARADLRGRDVIQVTGNGTRGAHAVREARCVAVASFANATPSAALVRQATRALLVPTEGDEDVALADWLVARVAGVDARFEAALDRVKRSHAGVECRARGSDPAFPGVAPDDLDWCLTVDGYGRALLLQARGDLLAVVPAESPATS